MTRVKALAPTLTVRVQRSAHAEGLPLPAYQTSGAAGLDLTAAVPEKNPVTLKPGTHALVPTGLAIALPAGYEAQVRPRSGLALKQGVTVLNSPGTIDSDYRGEIQVILVNLSRKAVVIRRGERIAQMVIAPVAQARLIPFAALEGTARGAGGFGSTGKGAAIPAPERTKTAASKTASSRAVKKSSKVAVRASRSKAVPPKAVKPGRTTRK